MYLKSFLKGSSPLSSSSSSQVALTRGGVTCQILDFFFVLYWFNGCGNSDEESNYRGILSGFVKSLFSNVFICVLINFMNGNFYKIRVFNEKIDCANNIIYVKSF